MCVNVCVGGCTLMSLCVCVFSYLPMEPMDKSDTAVRSNASGSRQCHGRRSIVVYDDDVNHKIIQLTCITN